MNRHPDYLPGQPMQNQFSRVLKTLAEGDDQAAADQAKEELAIRRRFDDEVARLLVRNDVIPTAEK